MANPGLIKNYGASGSIAKHRIVALAAADFTVGQANGAAKAYAGVSDLGSDKAGRCDVIKTQTAPLEFGANVAAGDPLIADADGKGIPFDKAAFGEDAQVWVIGTAEEAGDAGTIGTVTVNPFMIVK